MGANGTSPDRTGHGAKGRSAERRQGEDRRRHHLRAFLYQFVRARRRGDSRRAWDSDDSPVDLHEPRLFLVSVAILALCIVDVFATVLLLERGSIEVNPFMRRLIDLDVGLFFAFKYLSTALGIFILLSFRRSRLVGGLRARRLLYLVLAGYALLALYQLFLVIASA